MLLGEVVDVWTPAIEPESVAEMRLLRQLGGFGAVGVVTRHDVFDAAVPELRAGLEYDGVDAHNPRRRSRDEPRYARLEALGWKVDAVDKADLVPGEPRLRRLVEGWMARRAA